MREGTKMMQLVGVVSRKTADGKSVSSWSKIGVAFQNRDNSWNLRFDYFPARYIETTIQLRDFDPKDDEPNDNV